MVDGSQNVDGEQHRQQYREIQVNGQEHKGGPTPAAPPASAKAVTLETRIATRLVSKTRTASVAEGWEQRAGARRGEPAKAAAAGARELGASAKERALQPVGLNGEDQSHDRQYKEHKVQSVVYEAGQDI